MSRTTSNVFQSLRNKLASGFALAAKDGVIDVILSAFATVIAEAEASAEALMSETDPRQANQLLSDFERCLGPDPCGRTLGPLTVEQRQKLAFQRWTARGGQGHSPHDTILSLPDYSNQKPRHDRGFFVSSIVALKQKRCSMVAFTQLNPLFFYFQEGTE